MTLPPLRERREDIPVLAQRFAARAASETGKDIQGFEPEALEFLAGHDWPGNVRQLQHAVERAAILSTESLLRMHLFAALRTAATVTPAAENGASSLEAPSGASGNGAGGHVLALPSLDLMEVERRVIEHALVLSGGNRTRAAQLLGINVRTLRRKLNGGDAAMHTQEIRGRVA
jgi:DNA-binding NtrC family response regulator